MHKPLRITKDDARVRLTQQVNLTSAIRTALLTLPETFDERQLFERIAALSYRGDLRMALPFENRSKISNIVNAQTPQFKELYYRLVVGLPGVEWSQDSTTIRQDRSPETRASHVRKLPSELRSRIESRFIGKPSIPSKDSNEPAYWARVAEDPSLPNLIQSGENNSVGFFLLNIYRLHALVLRSSFHRTLLVQHPDRQGSANVWNRNEHQVCRQEDSKILARRPLNPVIIVIIRPSSLLYLSASNRNGSNNNNGATHTVPFLRSHFGLDVLWYNKA
jgi:hypothetical protein